MRKLLIIAVLGLMATSGLVLGVVNGQSTQSAKSCTPTCEHTQATVSAKLTQIPTIIATMWDSSCGCERTVHHSSQQHQTHITTTQSSNGTVSSSVQVTQNTSTIQDGGDDETGDGADDLPLIPKMPNTGQEP